MTPCAKDKNFGNCKSFEDRRARPETRFKWAVPGKCPKCDLKDDYDGNKTRVIKKIDLGLKLGQGPSRKSSGVEIMCCTIQ